MSSVVFRFPDGQCTVRYSKFSDEYRDSARSAFKAPGSKDTSAARLPLLVRTQELSLTTHQAIENWRVSTQKKLDELNSSEMPNGKSTQERIAKEVQDFFSHYPNMTTELNFKRSEILRISYQDTTGKPQGPISVWLVNEAGLHSLKLLQGSSKRLEAANRTFQESGSADEFDRLKSEIEGIESELRGLKDSLLLSAARLDLRDKLKKCRAECANFPINAESLREEVSHLSSEVAGSESAVLAAQAGFELCKSRYMESQRLLNIAGQSLREQNILVEEFVKSQMPRLLELNEQMDQWAERLNSDDPEAQAKIDALEKQRQPLERMRADLETKHNFNIKHCGELEEQTRRLYEEMAESRVKFSEKTSELETSRKELSDRQEMLGRYAECRDLERMRSKHLLEAGMTDGELLDVIDEANFEKNKALLKYLQELREKSKKNSEKYKEVRENYLGLERSRYPTIRRMQKDLSAKSTYWTQQELASLGTSKSRWTLALTPHQMQAPSSDWSKVFFYPLSWLPKDCNKLTIQKVAERSFVLKVPDIEERSPANKFYPLDQVSDV